MTDDRQRLRREAVTKARTVEDYDNPVVLLGAVSVLAMESLLVEAEAEAERLTDIVRALADQLGDDWEDYGVHDE